MFDALERAHQCATIQLDFQLPIRFKLKYVNPLSPCCPTHHPTRWQLPPPLLAAPKRP